jgi:hypothetical protein
MEKELGKPLEKLQEELRITEEEAKKRREERQAKILKEAEERGERLPKVLPLSPIREPKKKKK